MGKSYTLTDIHHIFAENGLLANNLPYYEFRQGQVDMSLAVTEAFRHQQHLIVEAGTGVGKTLAYLIPALLSGTKTVVSTGTKNLQEQLFFKDVPFLKKHLLPDASVVYMKGRANYLCLKRFNLIRQQALFQDDEEIAIFKQIQKWAKETKSGDRAEVQGIPDNYGPWREVCCTRDTCPGRTCEFYSQCFLMKMKKEADDAALVIVNHHLFFADLAVKGLGLGTVIPEYEAIIFDEAHLLEDIATSYFSVSVNSYQADEIAQDVLRELTNAKFAPNEFMTPLNSLQKQAKQFFQCFENQSSTRFRLREQALDKKIQKVAPELANSLLLVTSKLRGLKDAPEEIRFLADRIDTMRSSLEFVLNRGEPGYVYWCESVGRGIFLHASPIDIASDMRRNIFDQFNKIILTSATLSTGKNFEFLRERLGVHKPVELIVDSPFDYQKQAVLYLPKGMPDPNSESFMGYAVSEIERILKKSKGRAFLLFTSYKNMEDAYNRLKDKLPYKILKQGQKNRTALLDDFKKDGHAVLFATSSFWQGVDVQGEALSCVVIDKLPFAVPSEPIVEARIDWLRQRNENPFMAYQVPSAIITLKQGLGRLIRSKQDKGILSILDNRLITKQYGQVFLDSLPKCRVVRELDEISL